MNKARDWFYRFSIIITAILAIMGVIVLCLAKKSPQVLEERNTMMTIAVTLAGFLFAGQGILLSLPASNRFVSLVKQHGYMVDFHRMCRFAEISFLASILTGFKAFSGTIANFVYLFLFLWGMVLSFWAIWLFGCIVHSFTRSENSRP